MKHQLWNLTGLCLFALVCGNARGQSLRPTGLLQLQAAAAEQDGRTGSDREVRRERLGSKSRWDNDTELSLTPNTENMRHQPCPNGLMKAPIQCGFIQPE